MDDDRNVVDQALDLFVYAPLGLALEAKDLLPRLVERGRGQVALARLAGRFAARRGQQGGTQLLRNLVGAESQTGPAGQEPSPDTSPPDGSGPFAGYDDLEAQAIIGRLEQMSASELQLVLDYESRHRARSTVISRIRQLQG